MKEPELQVKQAEFETLVANYRPNPEVIAQLSKVTLIMTLGPSGVGKTTLMRASGLSMVLGDCSRAPRPNEKNGVDYWFRSFDEMLADVRAGKYVQISPGAGGDLKGTRASSFPSEGVATFAVMAVAIPAFRSLPFAKTETAVIVPPSFEAWTERLGMQQSDPAERASRLQEARTSLEFALNDPQAKFILNDSIEAGAERLRQIASGQEPSESERAKAIIADLLHQITTTYP